MFVVNAVAGLVALAMALRVVPAVAQRVGRGARHPRAGARGRPAREPDLCPDRGAQATAGLAPDRAAWPRDVVLAAVFAVVELRVHEPLIDLRVFRDRQFSGAIFITVAAFFAYSGFVYFTALYLQQVRG